MRVLLVAAVAACLGACSDADEPAARGPNVAYKPPGAGWSCFRDRVPDLSTCVRPDACETQRANYATVSDRSGTAYDLTSCQSRTGVACFTVYSVVGKRGSFFCFETMTECVDVVPYARKSADFSNVSDCGAW